LGENALLCISGPGKLFIGSGSQKIGLVGRFNEEEAVDHLQKCLVPRLSPREILDKARKTPGSFHLFYSDGDRFFVQAPASGSRQTFFAKENDLVLISNRPSNINQVKGNHSIDESYLALGLVHPLVDYGLTRRTHWKNVNRLFAQERIVWTKEDGLSIETYWHPPERSRKISEAAPLLRKEMQKSLATLNKAEGSLSSDFSGGMDSTSLCCHLSEMNIPYRAYVEEVDDPDHKDAEWAKKVASNIGADLHILEAHRFPLPYREIIAEDGELSPLCNYLSTDAPCTIVRNLGRAVGISDLIKIQGSTTHIGGFGADELFTTAPSGITDAYPNHPWKALSSAKNLAQLRRWKYKDTVRDMLRQTSYTEWLSSNLVDLRESEGEFQNPIPLKWGPNLTTPPWVTDKARDAVREVLSMPGTSIEPQAPDRATHTALIGQRLGGMRLEPLQDIYAAQGIDLVFPYMDDNIMEIALSVRLIDVLPGQGFKPLLRKSMETVENGGLISRNTKGEFSSWVSEGLSSERERIAKFFSNSFLAKLGYIDDLKIQSAILDQMRPSRHTTMIEITLGLEIWLRQVLKEGK
ncbi:asparagine synthase-related protein, partial [Corynebacterium casei]|uniref:asparagine synthase-related protein n=3 Tax=Corynebacterium casei TaxID=160386 RepID=UPI003FD16D48